MHVSLNAAVSFRNHSQKNQTKMQSSFGMGEGLAKTVKNLGDNLVDETKFSNVLKSVKTSTEEGKQNQLLAFFKPIYRQIFFKDPENVVDTKYSQFENAYKQAAPANKIKTFMYHLVKPYDRLSDSKAAPSIILKNDDRTRKVNLESFVAKAQEGK